MPLVVAWLLIGAVLFTLKMGFVNVRMSAGDAAVVTASPYTARFLRAGSADLFWETLVYRLRRGAEQTVMLARRMAEEETRRGG